jgi:hypothetical protein
MSLDLEDSQELLKLFGNWDGLRSLLAQREYVGDEVMEELAVPLALPSQSFCGRNPVTSAIPNSSSSCHHSSPVKDKDRV